VRAASIQRFVTFGAVGFGVCGATALAISSLLPWIFALPSLAVLIAGPVGGASLGLAFNDSRLTPLLALHGAGGMFLELPIELSLLSVG
jgi:hypothetical protein